MPELLTALPAVGNPQSEIFTSLWEAHSAIERPCRFPLDNPALP